MMGSICAEPHHHHHTKLHPFLAKKTLRDLDIPPRKQHQLLRRAAAAAADSPKIDADNSAFSKFLPYNDVGGEDNENDSDDDPYSSDHFRMYEFKVRKCNRSRSHDWTDCPFAHPGEKARRRDPRRFRYSGTVCPDFRKGHCGKADSCEFSHGVFECWLHPSRYRTEACKDGKSCKRKICFFAHSSRQLRLVPDPEPPRTSADAAAAGKLPAAAAAHCCVYCHCGGAGASPTSTLIHGGGGGASPPMSPPISPYAGGRYGGVEAYKEALAELMATFDAVNLSGEASPSAGRWIDVNFNVEEAMSMSPQFAMSPSTPSPGAGRVRGGFFNGEGYGRNLMEESRFVEGGLGGQGPDLGWVNDLLT